MGRDAVITNDRMARRHGCDFFFFGFKNFNKVTNRMCSASYVTINLRKAEQLVR